MKFGLVAGDARSHLVDSRAWHEVTLCRAPENPDLTGTAGGISIEKDL
ncbi:hypothetical protein KZX45_07120 [Georgenia sp. EYE_87]|nr:hypothetical protein [Georgenia sp. EYE_87]MCK6210312.1 hypothetical protein [Georgenia sp. EYE_87]